MRREGRKLRKRRRTEGERRREGGSLGELAILLLLLVGV